MCTLSVPHEGGFHLGIYECRPYRSRSRSIQTLTMSCTFMTRPWHLSLLFHLPSSESPPLTLRDTGSSPASSLDRAGLLRFLELFMQNDLSRAEHAGIVAFLNGGKEQVPYA